MRGFLPDNGLMTVYGLMSTLNSPLEIGGTPCTSGGKGYSLCLIYSVDLKRFVKQKHCDIGTLSSAEKHCI